MRLFVAVELSDDLRRTASGAADALRRRLASAVDARWIPPENLHVTIRFIGHVPDDRVQEVLRAIGSTISVPPFDLRLGRCGVFPPSGRARVIWIGIDEGLAPCAAIHNILDERLKSCGFEPEERPFSAHLTLARVKDMKRGASSRVRGAIAALEPKNGRSRVTHVTLFQSRLSPSGARYEPVARIDLVP